MTGYDEPEGEPFGSNDNWQFGRLAGRCNTATGAAIGRFVGSDAATVLGGVLNTRYPKPIYRDYYTDVNTTLISEVENPNDFSTVDPADPTINVKDNVRDFLTYSVSEEYPYDIPGTSNYIIKSCISSDDMDWYYQNYYNEITKYKNAFRKDFISIWVKPNEHYHLKPPLNVNHTVYSHILHVSIGNYHKSDCGVICSCTDGTCVPRICGGSTQ